MQQEPIDRVPSIAPTALQAPLDIATPLTPATPWQAVVAAYLAAALDSSHTRRAYGRHLRDAFTALNLQTVAELTGADLARYRAHVTSSVTAPASQAQALAALRAFLTWARSMGAHPLPADVVRTALRTPRTEVRRPYTTLTELEIARILGAATTPRDTALLAVLLGAGLRVAECAAPARRTCSMREDADGGALLHVHQGKGRKDRTVPIQADVARLLRAILADRGPPARRRRPAVPRARPRQQHARAARAHGTRHRRRGHPLHCDRRHQGQTGLAARAAPHLRRAGAAQWRQCGRRQQTARPQQHHRDAEVRRSPGPARTPRRRAATTGVVNMNPQRATVLWPSIGTAKVSESFIMRFAGEYPKLWKQIMALVRGQVLLHEAHRPALEQFGNTDPLSQWFESYTALKAIGLDPILVTAFDDDPQLARSLPQALLQCFWSGVEVTPTDLDRYTERGWIPAPIERRAARRRSRCPKRRALRPSHPAGSRR